MCRMWRVCVCLRERFCRWVGLWAFAEPLWLMALMANGSSKHQGFCEPCPRWQNLLFNTDLCRQVYLIAVWWSTLNYDYVFHFIVLHYICWNHCSFITDWGQTGLAWVSVMTYKVQNGYSLSSQKVWRATLHLLQFVECWWTQRPSGQDYVTDDALKKTYLHHVHKFHRFYSSCFSY